MDQLQKIIDGKVDFQGQRLADRIAQETIALAALIGFLAGYFTHSLQLTLLIYGAGVLIALIAGVPPWPMFNNYPVTWLPNRSASTTTSTSTPAAVSDSTRSTAKA
ncbi:hypothetical protein CF326_g7461 [Tilletia indica]|nr:hypothetical protein CF326_g7461 [Tilletia indica]